MVLIFVINFYISLFHTLLLGSRYPK